MTSIVFLKETIYCNIFTYNYLRKKVVFLFFLHFWNLDSIFNSLEKKITLKADVFLNLRKPKNLVR